MKQEKEFKGKDLLTFDEVEGKVSAVFSVFNEIDSDGDVVLPKSIRSGYGNKGVVMCWGHDWKQIIGKGKITQDNDQAVFTGEFNMNTNAGKEAYETVKAMGDIQQWSFGFEVHDSEVGMYTKNNGEEQEVRYLKDVKVWEVSPVLVGANQNTHTLAVKEKEYEVNEAVKEQDDTVVEQDVEQDEADTTTAKEITGEKFTDEVDNLLIKLVALLERAKALTALRFGKNKTLSESSTEALSGLRDALQDAHNEVDTLLRGAGNENVEVQDDLVEVNELWLQTTNLLADTIDL
jgi:HK97 family phage prohead protease